MNDTELDRMQRDYPLSPRWERPSVVRHVANIGGTQIHLVGLSTVDHAGQCAIGSAGQLSGSPLARAYFELVERTSLVEAINRPDQTFDVLDSMGAWVTTVCRHDLFPESSDERRWRYARSNGVATGSNWQSAACRAGLELVERDRVLRSWYGDILPQRIEVPFGLVPESLDQYYEFETYLLPDTGGSGDGVSVAAVFGFPQHESTPLTFGLGARFRLEDALAGAARECFQRLGFIWGEPVPESVPPFSPTPDFHLDYYLHPPHHAELRNWLRGAHRQYRDVLPSARPERGASCFVELTPEVLRGRLFVVKALPFSELPLTFGHGHPNLLRAPPEQLAIHPIA